ncbi:MAG: chemotaxis protein CheD [Leptospiraceae bacterium]|nr:chemotaxis protein CheD [Leptospiraceae bacterium]MDW7976063.1 chemotaxis protein CheD [Leptospiraceae bacterium]
MKTEKLVFLQPGELYLTSEDIEVKTILGSCVSVTVYNKSLNFGGICHYILPSARREEASTKFGNIAIKILIHQLLRAGSHISDLEAKIFGGASVIYDESEYFFIGEKNIQIAKEILNQYSISIVEEEVGGNEGRKLFFYPKSGKTKIEFIKKLRIEDLYNSNL